MKSSPLLLGCLAVVAASVSSAWGQGGSDSSSVLSLEEELAALRRELQWGTEQDDPWATGRIPDLVIASVNNVAGEVAPCG